MTVREKTDKILEIALVFFMSILVLDVLWQVASRYILSSYKDQVLKGKKGYKLVSAFS